MNALDPKALENASKWLSGSFDRPTKDAILSMQRNNVSEFNDAFYRTLEFGTGGLRGIMGVGTNRMNKYVVAMATQGFANYIRQNHPDLSTPKIVVSFDNRNQSRDFAHIVADVMSANGIKVYIFDDLRPTPELSFAIRYLHCHAGVMVTASHNPKEYNGYKAYWQDGGQLVPPHDKGVIAEVNKIEDISQVKNTRNTALVEEIGDTIDSAFLAEVKKNALNTDIKNKDLKIIYTPLHGTGTHLVPRALRELGFTNINPVAAQSVPDGNFPTCKSPNPEEQAAMEMGIAMAKQKNATLLMATDPDADRVGMAVRDPQGDFLLLNGNQTLSLICYYVLKQQKERGMIKDNHFIIKTIVTSELVKAIGTHFGVETFDVLTGFKWIADKIRHEEPEKKFICGGEESFGYAIGDFVRDKDGVGACCMIAEIAAWAKDNGKTIYDLLVDIYRKFGYYREGLVSVVRKGQQGAAEIKAMMEQYRNHPPTHIHGSPVVMIKDYQQLQQYDLQTGQKTPLHLPLSNVLQFFTANGNKITVRPSGTEPKIKFYFSVVLPFGKNDTEPELRKQADREIQNLISDLKINNNQEKTFP